MLLLFKFQINYILYIWQYLRRKFQIKIFSTELEYINSRWNYRSCNARVINLFFHFLFNIFTVYLILFSFFFRSGKKKVQNDTNRDKTIQIDTKRYKSIQNDTNRYKTIQIDTKRYKSRQKDTSRDKRIHLVHFGTF